jgi:hypothetical protein
MNAVKKRTVLCLDGANVSLYQKILLMYRNLREDRRRAVAHPPAMDAEERWNYLSWSAV